MSLNIASARFKDDNNLCHPDQARHSTTSADDFFLFACVIRALHASLQGRGNVSIRTYSEVLFNGGTV